MIKLEIHINGITTTCISLLGLWLQMGLGLDLTSTFIAGANVMQPNRLSIKRNITSLERHSLKSEALKLIIIGHRLAIVLLIKHISKNKFAWVKKEQNAVKSQEVTFSKITETACLPSIEFGMDKSQYGGYILNLPLKFNKQYFSWLFAISPQFCPFWQKQPFDFSDVLH